MGLMSPPSRRRLVIGLAALLALADACGRPVDLTGRPCPCAVSAGYVCCAATASCILAGATCRATTPAPGRDGAAENAAPVQPEAVPCPEDQFRNGARCVSRVVSVAASKGGTCAILKSGEAWCWGGSGFASRPEQVPGISNARQISMGGDWTFGSNRFACAATLDGHVMCWGDNSWSALGANEPDRVKRGFARPVVTVDGQPLADVQQVAAGYSFACATTTHGLYCWGENSEGQLGAPIAVGNGVVQRSTDEFVRAYAAPVANVPAGAVTAGWQIAVSADGKGQICGWGGESGGQRYWPVLEIGGVPGSVGDPVPRCRMTGNVVQIGAGSAGVCTRDEAGSVACWGSDLGPNDLPGSQAAIPPAIDLAAGADHTCAAVRDGHVFCWGKLQHGELGNGDLTSADQLPLAPQKVLRLDDAIAVGAGWSANHTCAIRRDGSLVCWGLNDAGQLGNASAPSVAGSPVTVDWN
jgi:hypothetical protein